MAQKKRQRTNNREQQGGGFTRYFGKRPFPGFSLTRPLVLATIIVLLSGLIVVGWRLTLSRRPEAEPPPIANDADIATQPDSAQDEPDLPPSGDGTPVVAQFVSNQSCAECHARQFEQWQNSHHDQAMQVANAQTVRGDFDDATFTAFGVTSRFFKRDGGYFIYTQGSDGEYADFEVKYTFGTEPLQQYLLTFPNGQLQAFTVAWDVEQQQWFSLYPDEAITPDDPLHWTGRLFTWNSSCAECHSTDLKLNYNLDLDSYTTTWAEIDVSCQACHGPGETHIQWARDEQSTQTEAQAYQNKGLLIDLKEMGAQSQIEHCAPCHSRRYPISANDTLGEPFLDHFMPELLSEGLYHADGQILDEVYVYGSFVQSKMAQQGVRCTDCHNPHTLKLRAEGNALCVACHQPNPPTSRFATLPAKAYDSPEHHFHQPASAGAQCVNCHMPAQTYMVIDPRRDHSFRIPRPDLSRTIDTPNACTQCHTDQAPEWAVETMTEWYGTAWQRPHYGTVLAAGRARAPEAGDQLTSLVQDETQPEIVRATALELLGFYGDQGTAARLVSLQDDAPLLRAVAAQEAARLPTSQQEMALAPLLEDPIRAVRIEAANVLAGQQPPIDETHPQQTALAQALAEYKIAQLALSDHPEGHFNLGQLYTKLGQAQPSITAYQAALKRDAHFIPAYQSLASLYYQQGQAEQAEQLFRQALDTAPDHPEIHYSLGLLLAEQQRFMEALHHVAKATQQRPTSPRFHYNYGLLLQQMSRFAEAEAAFLRAVELSPEDPDMLYGIISFYANQKRPDDAWPYAARLTELYPDVPEFRQLAESLRPH